jgi:hypothetical protein
MSKFIYARQSSGDEERSISVEQQISNCIQLAKKVDGVFKDLNTSGRLYWSGAESLAQLDFVFQNWIKETKKKNLFRTGLGDLFKVLKDKDIIYVDDITRLYRPLTNSYLESALVQFLLSKQIRIITVKTGEVDLSSFNDNLINALQNRINDNQLTIQRKKSKDSFKRLYNSGELKQSLGMMVGYKSTGKKKEVEVDPIGSEVVKYIYKSYIEGKSILQTIRELNQKFNYSVTIRTFKTIIERPLYCGYMYNKQGALIKAKQVEGKEIIDFQTWTTAKQLLDSRKNGKYQVKKYPNHFTSLVKCGKCGATMSVLINNTGKYISFRCLSHVSKNKDNCKISITANTAYKRGLSLDDALEPILILGLLKKLSNIANTSTKAQLEQKRIELQNLITAEQKLTEMFLNGLLDSSVYEQNLKNQQEKKQAVQQDIIQFEQDLAEDDGDRLRMLINKIVGRGLTFEQYQELIPLTIKQIDVFEQEIIIRTFCGDITLPRHKFRGILCLPEYKWRNTGTGFKIYYHFNTFNIYKPQIKIFNYNNFNIYMQGD